MNGASRLAISPELALVEPRGPCRVPTFQIPLLPDESFRVVGTRDGYVGCSWPGCTWHFHPELQISHIIRAAGERVVGDSLQPIESGEVVLLGPNVPHVWKYDHPAKGEAVDVLTVHFREDFLGSEFLGKPELWDVRRLLSRSRQGLLFLGKTREQLAEMIVALGRLSGLPRLLKLLSILQTMAVVRDVVSLSNEVIELQAAEPDQGRLQHVCAYIARHFDQPIDRDSVAEVACLSPGAFSRFFKARTGSTFHDYVAAVRIGHACRLLFDEETSITEIAHRCGFEDLSTFNRSFRRRRNMTPIEYRRRMLGLVEGGRQMASGDDASTPAGV